MTLDYRTHPLAEPTSALSRIWYSDDSSGTGLASFIGVNTSRLTLVDKVGKEVKRSQNDLRRLRAALPFRSGSDCGNLATLSWGNDWVRDRDEPFGTLQNNATARDFFTSRFPDVGLKIETSRPSQMRLKYKLMFYAYGWSIEAWAFGRVFAPAPCAHDISDTCCDMYQVVGVGRPADGRSICETFYEGVEDYEDDQGDAGLELETFRNGVTDLRVQSTMSWISNALLRTALSSPEAQINTYYVAFPAVCIPSLSVSFAILLGLCFIPWAVSLLFPLFASMVTEEKRGRLYHAMGVKGLAAMSYWFSTYLYGFGLFFVNGMVFYGFAIATENDSFTNADSSMVVVVLLVWSHAQVMISYLLAGLFSEGRQSMIAGFIIILLTSVGGAFVNFPAFEPVPYPTALVFIPPFAFSRILTLVFFYDNDEFVPGSEVVENLLYLFVMSSVCGVVGLYLHLVIPNAKYSTRHPLFFILEPYHALRRQLDNIAGAHDARKSSPELEMTLSGSHGHDGPEGEPHTAVGDTEAENDSEVQAAIRFVLEGKAEEDPQTAVLLKHFYRIYPGRSGAPPKVAVDDVTLSIKYGECFGLLGPNGAGKTTLLETLGGLARPSKGQALVGGVDMSKNPAAAFGILGVCPQFDVHWPELTVAEHLYLFARLKGIPSAQLRAAVTLAATKVNLDGDAFGLRSVQLSGGMRRRLSIAAALVGNPKIIILDEPTTGLDPDTRRQLWGIIEREKSPNRLILITTHSMEEADTLCTRIGIMAGGRLRVLGSQQQLKSRYGSGFKLDLTVVQGQDEPPTSFVHALCPEASLVHHTGNTVSYALPRGGFSAAEALSTLQSKSRHHGVSSFSLAQPSLEEVFVNIAVKYTQS
uniref:ABC transporter domain-containing protein n=1 Tax=Rhizochromulina marina TaxID=1034831 RepID=A0A7S2RDD5_9STRA|mmetsp:Transcript_14085/g.41401  ORF Transcript_14085/g.41401 Transcript_14085/m.41401 type:complete len:868 (+) Transcript_14085:1566-4169(+)